MFIHDREGWNHAVGTGLQPKVTVLVFHAEGLTGRFSPYSWISPIYAENWRQKARTHEGMGDTEFGRMARVGKLENAVFWAVWANFFKQTDVNRV